MLKRFAWGAAFAALAAFSSAQNLFDGKDRRLVKRTLESEVKMDVGTPPYADHRGAWQVRLTPEGSKWLYTYQHSQPPDDNDHSSWADWIDAKIAYDRAVAAHKADKLNGKATADDDVSGPQASDADFSDAGSVGGMSDEEDFSGEMPPITIGGQEVQNPGPMPDGLRDFMSGDAPTFAAAVKPQLYKVSFNDGATVSFINQAPVSARFAYLRSSDGVISGGTPLKTISDDTMTELCKKAGIDESTWHVMRAVSSLEGGFDSINTYDTGYVSAGFIQFTTGASGAGSLAKVLLREKTDNPEAFRKDFHRYGVDVTSNGILAVYDPQKDEELVGEAAVQQVIKNKCFTGVLVHAGRQSDAFKVAQLEVAKDHYYVGDDIVKVRLNNQVTPVRVGDVVKSEAGEAILMDRKVNTGHIDPLPTVLQQIADSSAASSPEDLANCEDQIDAALKFRRDFLADGTLTQPGGVIAGSELGSRGGSYPRGRRKGKPAPKTRNSG